MDLYTGAAYEDYHSQVMVMPFLLDTLVGSFLKSWFHCLKDWSCWLDIPDFCGSSRTLSIATSWTRALCNVFVKLMHPNRWCFEWAVHVHAMQLDGLSSLAWIVQENLPHSYSHRKIYTQIHTCVTRVWTNSTQFFLQVYNFLYTSRDSWMSIMIFTCLDSSSSTT